MRKTIMATGVATAMATGAASTSAIADPKGMVGPINFRDKIVVCSKALDAIEGLTTHCTVDIPLSTGEVRLVVVDEGPEDVSASGTVCYDYTHPIPQITDQQRFACNTEHTDPSSGTGPSGDLASSVTLTTLGGNVAVYTGTPSR